MHAARVCAVEGRSRRPRIAGALPFAPNLTGISPRATGFATAPAAAWRVAGSPHRCGAHVRREHFHPARGSCPRWHRMRVVSSPRCRSVQPVQTGRRPRGHSPPASSRRRSGRALQPARRAAAGAGVRRRRVWNCSTGGSSMERTSTRRAHCDSFIPTASARSLSRVRSARGNRTPNTGSGIPMISRIFPREN